VIGQRAEAAAQQFSCCRMAHMSVCRVTPDRPAKQDPQHRLSHDVVGHRQRAPHAQAAFSCRSVIVTRFHGATCISDRETPGSDGCDRSIAARTFFADLAFPRVDRARVTFDRRFEPPEAAVSSKP
jgi:hypothetical protein